jgi:hypothetical protein
MTNNLISSDQEKKEKDYIDFIMPLHFQHCVFKKTTINIITLNKIKKFINHYTIDVAILDLINFHRYKKTNNQIRIIVREIFTFTLFII